MVEEAKQFLGPDIWEGLGPEVKERILSVVAFARLSGGDDRDDIWLEVG